MSEEVVIEDTEHFEEFEALMIKLKQEKDN